MKYLFIVFTLVLHFTCSKPEETYIKIPSQFTATIQESILVNGDRDLYLELSSMNSDYCPFDSLNYQTSVDSNVLYIAISDSYKSNDCFQRNSYLKSRIKLPVFHDSLNIQIVLGSASVIHSSAYIKKNYYHVEIFEGTGLIKKPGIDRTYQIPSNLIWGYAYPISSGNEVLMTNFERDIAFECNTGYLPKGYYSYFTILDNNVLKLTENPGIAGYLKNFYFPHSKSDQELIQFFESLAFKYSGLVGYEINSGSGKQFKSN